MKTSQIIVIIATIAVILINYLASEGFIGGITPDYISDKYPTYVTPAGYAFSIWGFIYLGVTIFTVYQAMPSQADNFDKVRGLYLLTCLANCAWIFLWHNQLIVASVGAILVLWAALAALNFRLDKDDSLIVRVPFGTYFGWVTAASIVNIAVALATLGINISLTTACLLIAFAAVLGVFFRLKISNAAYGLTVTWAIIAIAVKHGGVTAISFTAAIATIILLIVVITPFLRLPETKR